ncbi:MAG: anti-sigma factor antagonist [Candidatus Omnitrophica bacterium]|nr:anti-sigma factor antagonist [Candidatus Omnitrophota bacterium]
MLDIKARQKGNVIILDLIGRIDVDSANLIEIVGQCVRDGYTDILCNLECVEIIDYTGISALVIAYKEIINNKGRMKLACIPSHLRNIFGVAGLDRVMDIYPSQETALHSFQEDKIIEKITKMQLRRRFKRLPIEMMIELKPKYDKRAVCTKGDLLNLSGVGAYIYGCGQFKLGDELVLKLKLPPKGEELDLEAKVVWLPDKQIQPHFHPGIGVEFHYISTHAQQKLLEFIERNLSSMSSDKG